MSDKRSLLKAIASCYAYARLKLICLIGIPYVTQPFKWIATKNWW